jgi:hypothetical protein
MSVLFFVIVRISGEVHVIREVGCQDNIIAIKMLDNPIFLKRHYPATVLVHPIVDHKYSLSTAQRGFYKDGRIQLEDHNLSF